MRNDVNRRWLLASYPEGMPSLENWSRDEQPVPDPGELGGDIWESDAELAAFLADLRAARPVPLG